MQLAAEGKEEGSWRRLSHLLALIANVNRDAKRKPTPYTGWDFWHLPGERRQGAQPLTPEVLRAIGPAIANKEI